MPLTLLLFAIKLPCILAGKFWALLPASAFPPMVIAFSPPEALALPWMEIFRIMMVFFPPFCAKICPWISPLLEPAPLASVRLLFAPEPMAWNASVLLLASTLNCEPFCNVMVLLVIGTFGAGLAFPLPLFAVMVPCIETLPFACTSRVLAPCVFASIPPWIWALLSFSAFFPPLNAEMFPVMLTFLSVISLVATFVVCAASTLSAVMPPVMVDA
ncbi:Uncharacterised protein [Helicobacter mustelae]|nr:Uncharacterised protein [Helicobacter mustelae]